MGCVNTLILKKLQHGVKYYYSKYFRKLIFYEGEKLAVKVLIENEYIQIIYTEKQDIPFIVETEQNQENAEYVAHWSFELHENALSDTDILHLIFKNVDGQNIGYAIIKGITNQNDSIELMRMVIVNKGRGYGKIALSLIKKWCFEVKKAHRLWLDVKDFNVRAQHVYETQGFIREGVLRECIKVGDTYQSLVVMSILNQSYHL